MPIKIIIEGEYSKPFIICDHCGERIGDVAEGNYYWVMEDSERPPGAEVFFIHKRCLREFERGRPSGLGMMELDCLFVYLANNHKLDLQDALNQVKFFARRKH